MKLIVSYAPRREATVNQLLRRQRELLSVASVYYSKSYADEWNATAIGTVPLAVDIASLRRFSPLSTLNRKLRFYTSEAVAEAICSSDAPAYQAAKLWTRKECIFKLCGQRNPFPAEMIYNEDDFITVGTYRIHTLRLTEQLLLSVLYDTATWSYSKIAQ